MQRIPNLRSVHTNNWQLTIAAGTIDHLDILQRQSLTTSIFSSTVCRPFGGHTVLWTPKKQHTNGDGSHHTLSREFCFAIHTIFSKMALEQISTVTTNHLISDNLEIL